MREKHNASQHAQKTRSKHNGDKGIGHAISNLVKDKYGYLSIRDKSDEFKHRVKEKALEMGFAERFRSGAIRAGIAASRWELIVQGTVAIVTFVVAALASFRYGLFSYPRSVQRGLGA